MKEFLINDITELPQAVTWVLAEAKDKRKIMLYGTIGAGKTTFTKAFCQHFGVKDAVHSPTFSLINEYSYIKKQISDTALKPNQEGIIYHLDLYRLNNLAEAYDIGIEDLLYNNDFCLIEWAEIIDPILPQNILKIQFEIMGKNVRKIVILP